MTDQLTRAKPTPSRLPAPSRWREIRRGARRLWHRLISMRTALVLLFLLALASVPGSLLPQRPLNPEKVTAYLASHGSWGTFLDRIGAFDVFGSVWFAAIYLLLFASLIGCLIPRIAAYAKALEAKPLKAPKYLSRLAGHGQFEAAEAPDEIARRVQAELRPRWRTVIRTEDSSAVTVSAEKGYSREAGNLIFHISLLAALFLIAGGRLLSYQGSVVVTEGPGFCNTVVSYDSFHAGRWIDEGNLAPFCVTRLNSFTADYRDDGTASAFRADINYQQGADALAGTAPERHHVITVNHPLRLEGDRVYLINHGFSPTVTVKRPGQAAITDTAPFLPQDSLGTAEGVFKQQGPGSGHDLGLQGVFAPSGVISGGVVSSISPKPSAPVLALLAFTGDAGLDQGQPQSVYALDTTKMTRVAAKNLRPGQTMTLPDGTTVTFDGYKQWASFQVSHDPTQVWLLIAAIAMVTGLLGSLAVRRRRLWLRISPVEVDDGRDDDAGAPPPEPARSLVEVGGLARSDSGIFAAEFDELLPRLQAAANGTGGD